jgi:hypothetical protein
LFLATQSKKIVCFAGELLHASTMPALEDALQQVEMAAEKVAATKAAKVLAAWHHEHL